MTYLRAEFRPRGTVEESCLAMGWIYINMVADMKGKNSVLRDVTLYVENGWENQKNKANQREQVKLSKTIAKTTNKQRNHSFQTYGLGVLRRTIQLI